MAKHDTGLVALDRPAGKRRNGARRRPLAAAADRREHGLYTGLIRLHVLHHAAKETVYGFALIEELHRHGYALSAGTLYPILHGLERRGLLRSATERVGSTERRVYRATAAGRKALAAAKAKVRELFGELFEDAGGER